MERKTLMLLKRFLLPLLIVLLPAAGVLAQESTPEATADTLDGCRALMTNPAASTDDSAAIYVVEPTTTTVYGDTLYVSVDTHNFDISAENGDHWHLWLNGQLNTMVYEDSVAVRVAPGTYTLCAILGDPEHFDLGQPDGLVITVVDPAAGTPATQPLATQYAAPIREDNTGLLVAIVVAGVAAAGLGWWAGRLLPRLRKPSS